MLHSGRHSDRQYRVLPPEGSIRPFPPAEEVALEASTPILNTSTLSRRDERYPEQPRPIKMQVDMVKDAQGSAFFEAGQTKLIVAVHGPKAVTKSSTRTYHTKGVVVCQVEFLPGSRGPQHLPEESREESELSLLLQQALEPVIDTTSFPNAQVNIMVSVIEDDGDIISSAITAACTAMIQGSVPLLDTIIGTCIASISIDNNNYFLIDPTRKEMLEASAILRVGWLHHKALTSLVHLVGAMEASMLQEAFNLTRESSITTYEAIRRCIQEQLGNK
jgi:exosome complex component RRP41